MNEKEKLAEFKGDAKIQSRYLTIEELCQMLKLKKSYIYDLTYRKKIPFIKIGRHLRFDLEEVTKWLTANKVEPKEPDWAHQNFIRRI